ncbi:hypothetical protein HK098_005807 [Nowakowskiella sp. JEL0407]|nr:hypothetical protein HK098_005807 [Nowakowskiella sp. JEL0407]
MDFYLDNLSFAFNSSLCSTLGVLSGHNLASKSYVDGFILITGCDSSAIAWNSAKYLAGLGYNIFAGVNRNESFQNISAKYNTDQSSTSGKIIPFKIDVLNDEDIQKAFEFVQSYLSSPPTPIAYDSHEDENDPTYTTFPKQYLIALINTHSKPLFGPLELTKPEELINTFENNAISVLKIINQFLPLLRESQGRVLNFSPGSGVGPGVGGYVASKTALETLTSTLRIELLNWKIPVILIEVGGNDSSLYSKAATTFPTPSNQDNSKLSSPTTSSSPTLSAANLMSTYTPLLTSTQSLATLTRKNTTQEPVFRALQHAITSPYPLSKYLCGMDLKVAEGLRRWVPEQVLEFGFLSFVGRENEELKHDDQDKVE